MMQSRILQSILLAASCSLFAPLAPAHVGEHADSGPLAQFAHLLTRADHWLVPLVLVCVLVVSQLLRRRLRS